MSPTSFQPTVTTCEDCITQGAEVTVFVGLWVGLHSVYTKCILLLVGGGTYFHYQCWTESERCFIKVSAHLQPITQHLSFPPLAGMDCSKRGDRLLSGHCNGLFQLSTFIRQGINKCGPVYELDPGMWEGSKTKDRWPAMCVDIVAFLKTI